MRQGDKIEFVESFVTASWTVHAGDCRNGEGTARMLRAIPFDDITVDSASLATR